MIKNFKDRQTIQKDKQTKLMQEILNEALDADRDTIIISLNEADIDITSTIDFETVEGLYKLIGILEIAKTRMTEE